MSQPKPAVQEFSTDWAKIKSWAAAQKIPSNAVANVQTLDTTRLQEGSYPMSNAERTRAILAASGLNFNTALPSDSPKASNVIGNTISNAQGIFSGLMPTRLVSNIFDTVKRSVDDVTNPGAYEKNGGAAGLLTNSLLSYVPGAYDVGTVLKAGSLSKGLEALAEQPLTSILDVMPALKALNLGVGAAAAETATGTALADRLGLNPKALGQMGALRMAGRGIGSVKIGGKAGLLSDIDGNPLLDDEGLPKIGQLTIGQRAHNAALTHGMGHQISRIAHGLMAGNNSATHTLRSLHKELIQTTAQLSKDTLDPATGAIVAKGGLTQFNEVMHSGREASDILNDSNVPLDVREAVKAYQPWEEWHKEMMVSAGKLLPLKLPDGTVSWYESSSNVFGWAKKADEAHAAADKASARSDEITEKTGRLEQAFAPLMSRITEIRDQIAGTVAMQPQLSATYLRMFGRLTGRDGLLETMQKASDAKDWRAFRDAATKAKRAMDSPHVKGRPAITTSAGRTLPAIAGWDSVPTLAELHQMVDHAYDYGKARVKLQSDYDRAFNGTVESSRKQSASFLNKKAAAMDERLMKEVRAHPPGMAKDAVLALFMKNFLASDKAEELMDNSAAYLKKAGYDPKIVDRIRTDPKRMYELVVAISDPTFRDPFIPNMTPGDHAQFMNSALKEYDSLRARGYEPMYVPTVPATQAGNPVLTGDRVYVNPMKYPTVNAGFAKGMDMSSTVNDVMLGVNKATQDILSRDTTIEFMANQIKPMLRAFTGLRRAVAKAHLGQVETDVSAGAKAVVVGLIRDQYGMTKFDIPQVLGLKNSDFGLDDAEEYYLPTAMREQIEGLVGRDQFPLHGLWDKTTGVFKYAILGLSPRYTAHILFGGSMLLALRINPGSFALIGKAAKAVRAYHAGEEGEIPAEVMQGAAQRGTPDVEVHYRGGRSMGRLTMQEWLAKKGINPAVAKAADWAAAAADINFRFTNYISDMQRAVAYLDGVRTASKKGWLNDPITGERVTMTADRAHWEGMRAAERVMGNLQAMTPLERSVARKVMPFYGWTKHIIKYVLTYPADHPWRAMFLSTLATQNTETFSKGLDERMQLLFFLGSPDAQGNVSAVDVRQLDPFRDVANYATLSGWISSLNPIISAPAAAIDPSIIYGDNTLYPNVTYNAVYGTNEAKASGGWLSAAEQEIPELGAVDQALGLSAQARAIKKEGGTAATKTMLSALGIPWTVQHLNLPQISAKHELDRYDQAASDAANAWDSGDFSVIDTYSSDAQLPDPLNKDYNITPAQLKLQYQRAVAAYPGLPPSETQAELPSPAL